MSLKDEYALLLIKQYWEQPKAKAEIELQAGTWERIANLLQSFPTEYDLDLARGAQLDVLGKIVGVPRVVPAVLPKVAFGFAGNPNARGFGDRFESRLWTEPSPFSTHEFTEELAAGQPSRELLIPSGSYPTIRLLGATDRVLEYTTSPEESVIEGIAVWATAAPVGSTEIRITGAVTAIRLSAGGAATWEVAGERRFVPVEAPQRQGAPFAWRFTSQYTSQQLGDTQYRQIIRAKAALNITSAYIVSDDRIGIQEVIGHAFANRAYVVDRQDMSLALYIDMSVPLEELRLIRKLGLLPKPQGVRYTVVQAEPGETFGFSSNPSSRGFADRFDDDRIGGVFARKVIDG